MAQQTVANQHDPQKYLNESESHYRRLIELYPQHAQAFHDLGVVLSMRAEYVAKTENLKRQLLQDSEVFFVRCLELKPSTQILEVCHGNLAHLYAMTGRFDEATYHGVQCLAYNPRNAVCATELKSTYAGSQMRSESLRIFMERIVENPDYAPGHTTFCLALFQRNLSTMAVQECEHAIRLDAQQCEAHFALANHLKQCWMQVWLIITARNISYAKGKKVPNNYNNVVRFCNRQRNLLNGLNMTSAALQCVVNMNIPGRSEQSFSYTFSEGEIKLGREQDNNIQLPLSTISRHHCVFIFDRGEWFVEDLESTHGSKLNEKPLQAHRRTLLRTGDQVRFIHATIHITIAPIHVSNEQIDQTAIWLGVWCNMYWQPWETGIP